VDDHSDFSFSYAECGEFSVTYTVVTVENFCKSKAVTLCERSHLHSSDSSSKRGILFHRGVF